MAESDFYEIIKMASLDWTVDFESREIQTKWSCIHGDLHVFNVLVSNRDTTTLIDYGNVGEGPVSMDPVTLELSALFHPQSPHVKGKWFSLLQAKFWGELDLYLRDSPIEEFIRACRDWAGRVSAGNRDVAASAYSYVVRQLKYSDTNHDLAFALLAGIKSFYKATT